MLIHCGIIISMLIVVKKMCFFQIWNAWVITPTTYSFATRKVKVQYSMAMQEPPSGESTTTECGFIINYLQ